jgi:hypothetical protein
MDERKPFQDIQGDANQAFDRIRSDVDQLVQELDFQQIGQRIQDFGREKPVILAFAALTVGLAAGLLMRRNGSLIS